MSALCLTARSTGLPVAKIKAGKDLPDEDHVIRYISWARLLQDEQGDLLRNADGTIAGFTPEAFALREIDGQLEDGLSVNWVEYFDGTYDKRVIRAIQSMRAARPIGKNSAFAVGQVATIKRVSNSFSRKKIKVVYAPTAHNLSHALIKHLAPNDLALMEALADEAFTVRIENNKIP